MKFLLAIFICLRLCTVTEVRDGASQMIDRSGNLWETLDVLEEGSRALVLFDTKGTVDITDDEIIRVFR